MPREISVAELAEYRASGNPVHLVDVREDWERAISRLDDQQHIPMNELPARAKEIRPAPGTLVVVYCHHGTRSLVAAGFLEKQGIPDAVSLAGGIEAWSAEIDPAIPQY